jgi:hypothetical protein
MDLNQWPYNRWWWPKNYPQLVLFFIVNVCLTLFVLEPLVTWLFSIHPERRIIPAFTFSTPSIFAAHVVAHQSHSTDPHFIGVKGQRTFVQRGRHWFWYQLSPTTRHLVVFASALLMAKGFYEISYTLNFRDPVTLGFLAFLGFGFVYGMLLPTEYSLAPDPDLVPEQPAPAPQPVIKDRITEHLWKVIKAENLRVPPDKIFGFIGLYAEIIYAQEPFTTPPDLAAPPPPPDSVEATMRRMKELEWAQARKSVYTAIEESMTAYVRALPHFEEGPFTRPLYDTIDVGALSYAMIQPFRSPKLTQFGLLQFIPDQFYSAAQNLHGKLAPRDRPKDGRLVMPQTYNASNAQKVEAFLSGSPLHGLFTLEVPFKIYDEHRFAHTWIMGRQGSGKTNLLSAQIWDDLQRMGRGECSVFIMDSQDNPKFVRSLAQLKQFAPSGPWHDRLIYLEPDLQYTPALNPLDVGDVHRLSENDRYEVTQTVSTVITSLFTSLLNTPLTGKQAILYDFFIPALIHIPGATLNTLLELLDDGYPKYAHHLAKAPEGIQRWFRTHLTPKAKGQREDEFASTRKELYYRIEGIFADTLFARMLSHKQSRLDLLDELNQPKVVIINTMAHRLKGRVEAFGRFFLARLLIAMLQRGSERNPLPCFAYIDEATDYIANEEKVATIIFKSRKQNLGLTVAHHDLADIKNDAVKASLKKAAVRMTPGAERFTWSVVIDQGISAVIKPPLVDFSQMEQMTKEEWQQVLREQRNAYCIQYRRSPEPMIEPDTYDKP